MASDPTKQRPPTPTPVASPADDPFAIDDLEFDDPDLLDDEPADAVLELELDAELDIGSGATEDLGLETLDLADLAVIEQAAAHFDDTAEADGLDSIDAGSDPGASSPTSGAADAAADFDWLDEPAEGPATPRPPAPPSTAPPPDAGVTCNHCGHAHTTTTRFCDACGLRIDRITQLAPAAPPARRASDDDETLRCRECGVTNSAERSRCTNCGCRLAV